MLEFHRAGAVDEGHTLVVFAQFHNLILIFIQVGVLDRCFHIIESFEHVLVDGVVFFLLDDNLVGEAAPLHEKTQETRKAIGYFLHQNPLRFEFLGDVADAGIGAQPEIVGEVADQLLLGEGHFITVFYLSYFTVVLTLNH